MDESQPSEGLNWPEICGFEGSPMSTECLRNVYGMSTEGYRRRVGLSRLYHGSIMYLSRHRLWVSIMYLSGVVHTSAQGHRRHLSVPTFCRNQSAPVGACRRRSVWTASTRAVDLAQVGTEWCRSSVWNNVGTGTCSVRYAIMWCLGFGIDFTAILHTFELVYMRITTLWHL